MADKLQIYDDLRILLLEDDEQARTQAMRALMDIGFNKETIDYAENGIVALDKIAQAKEPYELIIIDMVMPEMSGLDFLRNLQSNAAYDRVPKITLSSQEEQSIIMQALKFGAQNYLVKPVDSAVLAQKIVNAFETLNKV